MLLLARVEGLPYEEIGPILGRSTTAVKQLAYRALKRLRAELAAVVLLEPFHHLHAIRRSERRVARLGGGPPARRTPALRRHPRA